MDMKIEVITVPVTDVDRSLAFYRDGLGFVVDIDEQVTDGMRFVQLTPPGSACSIHIGSGITTAPPGSLKNVLIVVDDIEAARAELEGRSVEVSPVRHFEDGEWVDGSGNGWNAYVFFSDPDGNEWALQERPRDH